jgi:hypothetical protein
MTLTVDELREILDAMAGLRFLQGGAARKSHSGSLVT